MTNFAKKSSLTPGRERLIRLMQLMNFGRIENLQFRCGEPVFNPPPRIVQKFKLAANNGPRDEVWIQDFLLKRQVIEFFDLVTEAGDEVTASIEVKAGLTFTFEIENPNFLDRKRSE